MSLYFATGWRIVHWLRPDWLRDDAGEDGADVHVMVLTRAEDRLSQEAMLP